MSTRLRKQNIITEVPLELYDNIRVRVVKLRGYIAMYVFQSAQDPENDHEFYFEDLYPTEFNAIATNLARDLSYLVMTRQPISMDEFLFLVRLHCCQYLIIKPSLVPNTSNYYACYPRFLALLQYLEQETTNY